MIDISIRQANHADLESMQGVFRRASLSNEADRPALLAHPEALEFSDVAVMEGRTRVAIDADGNIVGFATVAVSGHVAELEDLFVNPESMRQGVARLLVLDAASLAAVAGIRRIEVTANRHALGFYEKVGFVRDGDAQTQFGLGLRMHLDVPDSAPNQ
jgi:GNAT superfamily N-acetyltransferase